MQRFKCPHVHDTPSQLRPCQLLPYLKMPLDLLKASGSGGPAGLPSERPRVQELLGRDDCSGSRG